MGYPQNNNYQDQYNVGNSDQYRNQQRNQKPIKKHSGAKEGIQRDGKNKGAVYVSAWIYRKGMGLVNIIAFENAASTRSESQRGNKFVTLAFEVNYKQSGVQKVVWAPYNLTTGKVFLEELGWCISTKARNGGFCGPIDN